MLSKENALLKKAYEASDIHEACHILSRFYSIRDKRLKTVKDRLGLDIIEFYPIIETVEGSARYIEYRLAREQGITDTDWMTNLDSNSYYYASGLYLMLIMDKFGIPYKDELFLKYFTLTELFQDISKQDSLLQDYDYFFSQLEQIHPDPYSAYGGKDGFDKAVKQLRDELANRDSLTLNEMQVEVTKLISALHDGHTYIGYDKAPKKVEDQWVPLKFKVIPDGIIVNGYTPELESLKGAMLREVEGEPIESVLDCLDKLVVSENRYGLMGKACRNIGNNNTLRQLFPTFNKEQVSMKFRMANGKDTLVSLPFYPNGPFWENIVWTSTDERFPHKNFEYRFIDDSKQTMVMCINSIVSADIPNLENYGLKSDVIVADVFAKMLREMKAANSPRLIIDLRGNGGGWTMIMYAALYELYGKRIMDTDLGMHFATKVSDGWLKKNNLTLEQLNQDRGTLLKMGDFIERPSNISSFDWFMCADMSILEAQDGEPIYTPEEIYVVTDVQTFSSAFHTAYMLWKMGAKVVGVTSGQAPNTFMEVTRFKLPNTGLECSASNSLQSCFPTDHPMAKTFTPDIQLSYDDYHQFDFSKDAELLYIEKQ